MDIVTIVPSSKYLIKSYVTILIIAVATIIGCVLMGALIALDRTVGSAAILWSFVVGVGINVLWVVPAALLMPPYARSLRYELHEDEVIMHVGVITRSVKYVPFRTVTNITVKRGLLDRLFGLGSLEIQTAGISGTHRAEQHLVGLEDPDAAYELVGKALRRFRGAMGPTAAEVEDEDVLRSILEEVRSIREALDR